MKNILDFSYREAKNFFLKEESYLNFDLPDYFCFSNLLSSILDIIGEKNISDFWKECPKNYENINYKLLNNKDGKYSWRPLQLLNPVLYVVLVNCITEEKNWEEIKNKFFEFRKDKRIECLSLPIESDSIQSDKAQKVDYWWKGVEQSSIKLSLDYDFLYHTDIADCYGSIYTHSISWALHGRDTAKKNKNNKEIVGNKIDKILGWMSWGQTNGIPQGSVLMDFIAEIVLGYADTLILKQLDSVDSFKIIRYRDDYRIFVKNSRDGEEILKKITEVLIILGMRLNTAKTTKSENIVMDSIKPDKLFWKINKSAIYSNTIQSELLILNDFADRFPNSGALIKQLQKIYERIIDKDEIKENILVLISITTNIAFKNPRTYPIATAILSKFIKSLKDDSKRQEIVKKIKLKFEKIPNTGHQQIWLQRVTLKFDKQTEYGEILCKKVNNHNTKIWNLDWLEENELKETVSDFLIVDQDKIDKLDLIIRPNEVSLFKKIYS